MKPDSMEFIMYNWVKKKYGVRCLSLANGCGTCEAWKAFDCLFQHEDD